MKKLVLLPVVLALSVIFALTAVNWYKDNRLPGFTGSASLYVYPETTSDDVLSILDEKGVVADSRRLARVFENKRVGEFLTPGFYYINPENSCVYLARMLNNGWESPVNLTLSGTIRTCGDIARKIGNQVLADSASVHKCLNDEAFMEQLGYTRQTVLSMFIPDTYQIYWTLSAEDILQRLKKASDDFWNDERMAQAAKTGLSRQEVSVLASIVSAESNYVPELSKIAGVYLNRLKAGVPLQADPTVIYGMGRNFSGQLLRKHLEDAANPYNTYRHLGLPPGPICSFGLPALRAAVSPEQHEFLYFVATGRDAGHSFSKTLEEHNRAVRGYREAVRERNKK